MYALIPLIILIPITALLLYRTWRTEEALSRLELLSDDIAGCCESLGFVGCSVVCTGVTTLSTVRHLLEQEYDRYEVVVVLDSSLHAEAFHSILSLYRLVRVNPPSTSELPTGTIRHLYRSRQRNFRRLILVDAPHFSPYDDLNVGTVVASFDYILPLGPHSSLYPKAIESIAILLSAPEARHIEWLYSISSHASLLRRDAIIRNCGFSAHILRQIEPSARLNTYTPIVSRLTTERKIFYPSVAIITLLASLLLVQGLTGNLRLMASTTLTVGLLWSVARYLTQLCQTERCSTRDVLCHFRDIVDIFPARNFSI